MNRTIIMISAAILMLTFTSTNNVSALNITTNDSYGAGTLMDSANQTTSELGQNASTVLNKAGQEVGSTLNQLGQNMSDVGSKIGMDILNETKETAKKVGTGAKDVLTNITGEIKQGVIGNSSK